MMFFQTQASKCTNAAYPGLIHTIQTDQLESNAYVIIGKNARTIVIDPGEYEQDKVMQFHSQLGLTPDLILLTHEHCDHIAGVRKLKNRYDPQIICSEDCSTAISDPRKNLSRYLNMKPIKGITADVTCETVDYRVGWHGIVLQFIKTPGHTLGSICIRIENNLFTGDTLLGDQKTITKLPGGSRKDLEKSLSRIMELNQVVTVVYPGHGDCFRLNEQSVQSAL